MRSFRAGTFERKSVHPLLRSLCPAEATLSLYEVDPKALFRLGKKLVLLDVDNTLLPWRGDVLPEESLEWVRKAKEAGLHLCILSNTRHPERLHRLADQLGIDYLRGRFKPSRQMYRQSLQKFGVQASEAVMIGDQLFTDVLGANRAGIDAIWVRPMTQVDFVGTRISRLGERIASIFLHRSLTPAETAQIEQMGAAPLAGAPIWRHPLIQQFAKFSVVGLSSTVIDKGLLWLLMFHIPAGAGTVGQTLGSWLVHTYPAVFGGVVRVSDAAIPVLQPIVSGLAILNSFYWNRRWTFQIVDPADRFVQLQKFLGVSITGMILNTIVTTTLNNVIPGHPKRSLAVASIVAIVVVAFWNFTGQKFFAFRKRT